MDIRITACPDDSCSFPGYRKVPQDLNKYSRGSFVHLHFTDHIDIPRMKSIHCHDMGQQDHDQMLSQSAITDIAVVQGQRPNMGSEWERIEGNLNDGNRGPILTLFVKRDPTQAPIDSLVVKYGYDSHAAIGYDRLPMDLNVGTGGQWVYLYYKKSGPRQPITHIATKACTLPPCTLDDSWTRINRPISTGTLKRHLYLFYKSVPGERPITSLNLSLNKRNGKQDLDSIMIDTGLRFKNNNVFVTYKRGQLGDHIQPLDNIAVELGTNQIPYNWQVATFDRNPEQDSPNWNAQIIYRTGEKALPKIPTLRLKRDGSFKIVQFADIHMATGPHSCHNAPNSMRCTGDINTLQMMERMLESEKPDLVVFTGDNVDGLTSKDAYATMLKYSKPVVDRAIPWTIIFGNHDEEGDLTREEMLRSAQDIPYSLAERGPLGISGTGNYVLSIYDHKHDHRRRQLFDEDSIQGQEEEEEGDLRSEKSRFTLYFLDSGAYSFNLKYPGWDWIKDDQVEWFRQTSKAITSKYHKDDVPNALTFFHIPIPEYDLTNDDDDESDDDKDTVGLKKKRRRSNGIVGDKVEGVSTPSYNSGMFDAIFESKDVRATTAGHDHLNDYCLDHRGINLCYGGGLGYGSYGSSSVPRRSRVFEILKHGDRVDTWKRLDDDEMTLVGQQTLFVGSKTRVASEPQRPTRPRTRRPNRMTDDLWENLTKGAQYILDGF
ncbi:purple acid phosphatase [Mortierella polycephala]|uniref:Purple acid phosphatase n=1 Tax=Mortierella polycephala TaxID=41804 RepID=A0A9P6UBB3_9FUNG|nr:purple acid phosphatase [Mortierella polycephala]